MNEKIRWEMRAIRLFQQNRIGIALWVHADSGAQLVAKPIELEAWQQESTVEPMLTLSHAEAQLLMEELWSAGVRPSQAAGSVGQLQAVEKHLADMRDLTFGLLAGHNVKRTT